MKKTTRSKYRAEYPVNFVFDYKDPLTLQRFLMEGGKIVPSRVSKLSNPQQKSMCRAVKKARQVGLLPVGNAAYDAYNFNAEQISPVPFEY